MRADMSASQPKIFLPFDRAGIDPLTERFPVTLRLEGTVRGTGGIRIAGEDCSTTVAGLYAAGDASTRELICGGFTGGGSHNAAWAISSGFWAGRAAAAFAKKIGPNARNRRAVGAGRAALRGSRAKPLDGNAIVRAVQAEVFPFDRNLFRTEHGLTASLGRLHELWNEVAAAPAPFARTALRGREAAAMVANARWMYATARYRTESRGMHKHQDFPRPDPAQQRRLVSGGIDAVWVRPEGPQNDSSYSLAGAAE
jgi:succinate dehydrogenase/fumarate reductase flavoprotein subunit